MLVFIYLLGGIMHKNTRNLTTEIEKKKERSKQVKWFHIHVLAIHKEKSRCQ